MEEKLPFEGTIVQSDGDLRAGIARESVYRAARIDHAQAAAANQVMKQMR
jgi:hypothetical protein